MRKNLGWATVPVALALAGCAATPPSAAPTPTPVSAAELVSWVDAACDVRSAFTAFWNSSAADYQRLKASADESGIEARTYVSARSREMQALASRLSELPPVNAPAPTAWRRALRDALVSPKAQLAALANNADVASAPDLAGRADQAAEVIAKLALPKPDLASADPALSAAYAKAPRCAPPSSTPTPTPTPTSITSAPPAAAPPAKDGQNFAACADGQCEVKVAKSARIPVFELKFATTFTGDTLSLTTSFPDGGRTTVTIGTSGAARFGRPGGSWIVITFKGVNAGAAVVEVATE